MSIEELFNKSYSGNYRSYSDNPHWKEWKKLQDECSHNWVYSPDKEKRICETCYKRERSRSLGRDGYFGSLWIAPPEEQDRWRPEVVIKKWKGE